MKKYFLFLFILASTTIVHSLEISKDNWVVEVGEFIGKNLSINNELLLTSIPNYFRDNIDVGVDHHMSEEEKISTINYLKEKREYDISLEITGLIKNRDNLILTNADIKNIEKIETEIKELKESLQNFEILLDKDMYELEFLPQNNESLKSLKEVEVPYYLEKEDVDYYIYGIIEEEDENLFITVKLFSKYRKSPIEIWNGIGSSEDILTYREEMLENILQTVSSKDIIDYKVEVTPLDSLIYIDNVFRGLGSYNGYTLNNNEVDILITKEGYTSISLTKRVSTLESKFNFNLKPQNANFVNVQTIPPGAKLYYGSKYIGTTPMDVELYSFAQKLTLSLEGYMEKSIVLDLNSEDIIIELQEGMIDRDLNLSNKKNAFYTGSGIFTVALGIPLYLNAVDGNINKNITNLAIGNAIFWGVNFFYRLYNYLNAAELSVE